ncbi:hypothetical protein PM3016_2461 [Paenibacillus mucilaginosus 3016]|uniref:Saccharopine dehydrogenase NADP binding domain-containing protein n=1 Tax=Paenibacillus mucilaginosus 3016 TaxID=1116391 RepID=H6NAA3_9BACL|nr:saccharopine dehydrogenase NADP-binding domain-containing protein [Paenibacillus mucilaginosus]AFC29349.1 hypothetical protein PM3016_2461 [Paenibacillus mucilaginosus 3016]
MKGLDRVRQFIGANQMSQLSEMRQTVRIGRMNPLDPKNPGHQEPLGLSGKEDILVVGGYGQVGQVVCRTLGEQFPGRVYAAGRDERKAGEFAAASEGTVKPLRMDVRDPGSATLLEQAALVVMCVDQENTRFVEQCLAQHTHYIDITASYDFLCKVRELGARENPKSTAVVSAGLAPGLTNLLAKQCTRVLEEVHSVELYLLLGLGEHHGRAAVEWMVDRLVDDFSLTVQGARHRVPSFGEGKAADFPGGLGRRWAYRFDFPDQHVLPGTLGIPSVSTRLCFDSAAVTRLLALAKKAGLLGLLRHPALHRTAVSVLGKVQWGSEVYAALAIAEGRLGGRMVRYRCSVRGAKEHLVTGRVAAYAAKQIYTGACRPGVYHLEELFEPPEVIGSLGEGVVFEEAFEET